MLIADAAKELGVSRDAIYKAAKRGQVRVEQLGPLLIIHEDEVEKIRHRKPGGRGRPRKPPPT